MNTNKLFDLRFVIGCFFAIVGLLLLVFSFVNREAGMQGINRWCGLGFLAFGVVMILLSMQKDAHDELLEEE